MYYNVQTDKAEVRSVTPGDVQQCLEGMGLDFSKYNQFKANQHRQRKLNSLNEIEKLDNLQRTKDGHIVL